MDSSRSKRRAVTAVIIAATVSYPLLVYLGLAVVPSWLFGVGVLALLVARRRLTRGTPDLLAPVLWAAGVVTAMLIAIAPEMGVRSYPVLVNTALGLAFAISLLRPR